MFGFVIGSACLIGLVAVLARGRRRHYGHWRGRGRGMLYGVLARLDATPGQEKAIGGAVEEFVEVARRGRTSLKDTRSAAARAVRDSTFDESPLREAFLAQDATLAEIREAAIAAGRKIHEALDDKQRKTLAELIESGPSYGHWGHHHHHGHCQHAAHC